MLNSIGWLTTIYVCITVNWKIYVIASGETFTAAKIFSFTPPDWKFPFEQIKICLDIAIKAGIPVRPMDSKDVHDMTMLRTFMLDDPEYIKSLDKEFQKWSFLFFDVTWHKYFETWRSSQEQGIFPSPSLSIQAQPEIQHEAWQQRKHSILPACIHGTIDPRCRLQSLHSAYVSNWTSNRSYSQLRRGNGVSI